MCLRCVVRFKEYVQGIGRCGRCGPPGNVVIPATFHKNIMTYLFYTLKYYFIITHYCHFPSSFSSKFHGKDTHIYTLPLDTLSPFLSVTHTLPPQEECSFMYPVLNFCVPDDCFFFFLQVRQLAINALLFALYPFIMTSCRALDVVIFYAT